MHFDPAVASAIKELKQAEHETIRLSDLASVELRNQFVRIWAKDAEHGIPYLNATDLLSLLALGIPASGQRYLSYKTETNSKGLVVHEGWLLMTCSGTIGRVFYVPQRLDGWAATHDIIRIVPHDQGITGYLYAWLSTPVAQAQILSHIHGGQIDHITDEQVAGTLVPKLPAKQIREIHEKVMKALHAREQAIQTLVNAWPDK